jgi:hypothetical protein
MNVLAVMMLLSAVIAGVYGVVLWLQLLTI